MTAPTLSARTLDRARRLLCSLLGVSGTGVLEVFDDQCISTGGQIHELLVGHDRMPGDIRPLAFEKLGIKSAPRQALKHDLDEGVSAKSAPASGEHISLTEVRAIGVRMS